MFSAACDTCALSPSSSAQPRLSPSPPRLGRLGQVDLRPVANGVPLSTVVANAGDGSGRLFVALRAGSIRVVRDGQVLPQPFLDLAGQVSTGHSDQGLLGLAFHPEYASNGLFYVTYTDRPGTRYLPLAVIPPTPTAPNAASAVILLGGHPAPRRPQRRPARVRSRRLPLHRHRRRRQRRRPGDNNRPEPRHLLLGKILRIDVDAAAAAVRVPPGNPFVGVSGGRAEIWAYGLRNPWRFSFDRSTGDLYIGDVGQNPWEEIDFEPAGAPGRRQLRLEPHGGDPLLPCRAVAT